MTEHKQAQNLADRLRQLHLQLEGNKDNAFDFAKARKLEDDIGSGQCKEALLADAESLLNKYKR